MTTQPQVVVVQQVPMQQMVQMNQPQTGGTGGGETAAQPTQIVVVQNPAPNTVPQEVGDRYPRWSYLVFGIGYFAWHFLSFLVYASFTMTASYYESETDSDTNYGALFFFCGVLPSLLSFIWLINGL